MIKILILTSSSFGNASHHIPILAASKKIKICGVILNKGMIVNPARHRKRRWEKIKKIGILGALNGIRMRSWYQEGLVNYLEIDSLEEVCSKYDIPLYYTDSINTEKTRLLFRESEAELGISLGNSYIAKSVFSILPLGMLNIHHEQLPDYQNASSVIWQLYNGSDKTGYTIHRIEKNIDEGDVLLQEMYPIQFQKTLGETVSKTYAGLWELSAKGLRRLLDNYSKYDKNRTKQIRGIKYTTPDIWSFYKIYKQYKRLTNKS